MHLRRLRAAGLDLQDVVHYACLSLFIMVVILVMYRHFWQGKVHCQCEQFTFTLLTSYILN